MKLGKLLNPSEKLYFWLFLPDPYLVSHGSEEPDAESSWTQNRLHAKEELKLCCWKCSFFIFHVIPHEEENVCEWFDAGTDHLQWSAGRVSPQSWATFDWIFILTFKDFLQQNNLVYSFRRGLWFWLEGFSRLWKQKLRGWRACPSSQPLPSASLETPAWFIVSGRWHLQRTIRLFYDELKTN